MSIRTAAVVILGMHRSGSSAIAKAAHSLGVNLGENLVPPSWEYNPKGFWENQQIVDINERLLRHLDADWKTMTPLNPELFTTRRFGPLRNEARRILKDLAKKSSLIGFKDPRICRLLSFWNTVLDELGYDRLYLVCHRHPSAIANSLYRRDKLSKRYCLLLWLAHIHGMALGVQNDQTLVVGYERLLAEPKNEMTRLLNFFSLNPEEHTTAIHEYTTEFLDPGLSHHHSQPKDLSAFFERFPMVQWILDRLNIFATLDSVSRQEWAELVEAMDHLELLWETSREARQRPVFQFFDKNIIASDKPELIVDTGKGLDHGSVLRPRQVDEGVFTYALSKPIFVESFRVIPCLQPCTIKFLSASCRLQNGDDTPVHPSWTNATVVEGATYFVFDSNIPSLDFTIRSVVSEIVLSYTVLSLGADAAQEKHVLLERLHGQLLLDIEKKINRITSLEHQLKDEARERDSLFAKLKAEIDHHLAASESAATKALALTAEKNVLVEQLETIRLDFEDFKSNTTFQKENLSSQYELQLDILKRQNNELDCTIDSLQEKILNLKSEESERLKQIKIEHESVIAAINEKEMALVAKHNQQITDLNSDIDGLKNEKISIIAQRDAFDQDIQRLRSLVKDIRIARERDRQLYYKYQYALQEKERVLREKLKNAAQLNSNLDTELKQTIEKFQQEKNCLDSTINNLSQRIGELKNEHTDLKNTYQALAERENSLYSHAILLQEQLDLVYASKSWKLTTPLRWGLARLLNISGLFAGRSCEPVTTAEESKPSPALEIASATSEKSSANIVPSAEKESTTPELSTSTFQEPITTPSPSISSSEKDRRPSREAANEPARYIEAGETYDFLFVIGCLEGESKRYRVYNIIDSLRRLGFSAAATVEIEADWLRQSDVRARRFVFFRLAWSDWAMKLLRYAEEIKAVTYFDVDDLIFEPENIHLVRAISSFDPIDKTHYLHGVQRYRYTLEACDAVITPTSFLTKRAASLTRWAVTIPNTVNPAQIDLADELLRLGRNRTSTIKIGYFSGTATHDTDFRECETALLQLMESRDDIVFILVGYLNLSHRWKPFEDRIITYDYMPYLDLLRVLAEVDICLAPLELGNPYCEGKSQLKFFEAALLNVPTVASATSAFRDAIIDGVDGFLATNSEEWSRALNLLADSSDLRDRIGAAARTKMLEEFSPSALDRILPEVYKNEFAKGLRLGPQKINPTPQGRVGWIVPGLLQGSGGHRTIFYNAAALTEAGYETHIHIENTGYANTKDMAGAFLRDFGEHDFTLHLDWKMNQNYDIVFATSHPTVPLVHACSVPKKAYFVQDYEVLFFPMSDDHLAAENTYTKNLEAITIGRWLSHKLFTEHGLHSQPFDFCADLSCYQPLHSPRDEAVCFIYQPQKPRRCAALGLEALALLKKARPSVKIYLFGSQDIQHNIPFEYEFLSFLTPEQCNDLYNHCQIGLCISSSNPSRVPFEMMAAGLPVVEIYRENNLYDMPDSAALLAHQDPKSMAEAMLVLLNDKNARADMSHAGVEFMQSRPLEHGIQQFLHAVENVLKGQKQSVSDPVQLYNKPMFRV